jgi:hypothetical protein
LVRGGGGVGANHAAKGVRGATMAEPIDKVGGLWKHLTFLLRSFTQSNHQPHDMTV